MSAVSRRSSPVSPLTQVKRVSRRRKWIRERNDDKRSRRNDDDDRDETTTMIDDRDETTTMIATRSRRMKKNLCKIFKKKFFENIRRERHLFDDVHDRVRRLDKIRRQTRASHEIDDFRPMHHVQMRFFFVSNRQFFKSSLVSRNAFDVLAQRRRRVEVDFFRMTDTSRKFRESLRRVDEVRRVF